MRRKKECAKRIGRPVGNSKSWDDDEKCGGYVHIRGAGGREFHILGAATLTILLSYWSSPGQGLSLHAPNSRESPSHVRPPYAGVGLLHSRVRDLWPRPHVTLHSSQTDHSDQPPSTAATDKHDSAKYSMLRVQTSAVATFWALRSKVWDLETLSRPTSNTAQ